MQKNYGLAAGGPRVQPNSTMVNPALYVAISTAGLMAAATFEATSGASIDT